MYQVESRFPDGVWTVYLRGIEGRADAERIAIEASAEDHAKIWRAVPDQGEPRSETCSDCEGEGRIRSVYASATDLGQCERCNGEGTIYVYRVAS